MTPNDGDQALIEKLKLKYSKDAARMDDQGAAVESAPLASQVKLHGDVEAKMCPICQGMGVVHEEYNHRRMEKMCVTCDGQGVKIYKDGVEVKAQVDSNTRADDLMVARKQSLEMELAKIQAKLESLQEERATVVNGMSNELDKKGLQLRQVLASALDAQIKRLGEIQVASKAKLTNQGN